MKNIKNLGLKNYYSLGRVTKFCRPKKAIETFEVDIFVITEWWKLQCICNSAKQMKKVPFVCCSKTSKTKPWWFPGELLTFYYLFQPLYITCPKYFFDVNVRPNLLSPAYCLGNWIQSRPNEYAMDFVISIYKKIHFVFRIQNFSIKTNKANKTNQNIAKAVGVLFSLLISHSMLHLTFFVRTSSHFLYNNFVSTDIHCHFVCLFVFWKVLSNEMHGKRKRTRLFF